MCNKTRCVYLHLRMKWFQVNLGIFWCMSKKKNTFLQKLNVIFTCDVNRTASVKHGEQWSWWWKKSIYSGICWWVASRLIIIIVYHWKNQIIQFGSNFQDRQKPIDCTKNTGDNWCEKMNFQMLCSVFNKYVLFFFPSAAIVPET